MDKKISKDELETIEIRHGDHGTPPNEEKLKSYLQRTRGIDIDKFIELIRDKEKSSILKRNPKAKYKNQFIVFAIYEGKLYGAACIYDFDEDNDYVFIKNILPIQYWL